MAGSVTACGDGTRTRHQVGREPPQIASAQSGLPQAGCPRSASGNRSHPIVDVCSEEQVFRELHWLVGAAVALAEPAVRLFRV